MSLDPKIIARLMRRPVADPKPHLLDFGHRVERLTSGDVAAITAAAVRLFRGDSVYSTTRAGRLLAVAIDHASGDAVLAVDGAPLIRGCAHDVLVHAYNLISNFNVAWDDFRGRV